MKIIIENKIPKDNYTEYVCEKYDIQDYDKVVTEIPSFDFNELKTFDWNIGIICGNSGSGKSTILNNFGIIEPPKYDLTKSIVSQFQNLEEKDVCELLCSVGLSSIPTWLHKPNELSNGERARLDIAWYLSHPNNSIILIDEFSSTVDRNYAKSMSFALQRYVRKKDIKIILATCHFDLMDYLKPDWIFNLNKQQNGESELERIIYMDEKDFEPYKKINNESVLSDEFDV